MFDELKIILTGDTSGLESAMKKAFNVVAGGVDKMNDQEVDWTSIFSRSVSPAIISGVASMFAFAIAQSVQFQSAMNLTGEAAGMSSTQITQMGAASQQLAAQTGQDANDIGAAFGAISPVFADTATQQTFVTEASQLAASGFGKLSEIVAAALPIMQLFGVTTSEQVTQVFTDLMHGAQGSGESLSAFAGQFLTVAPNLKAGGVEIKDLNSLLSGFSAEIATLGLGQATAAFDVFGKAVAGGNPELNAMLGSSKSLLSTVRDQGLPEALAKMGDKIQASGESAMILYKNFGLSTIAIDGLESSATRLLDVNVNARRIGTSTLTIKDAFDQSDNSLRHLNEDWEKLKADFTAPEMLTFLNAVADGFMNIEGLMKNIIGKGFIGTMVDGVKDLAGTFTDFFKSSSKDMSVLMGEEAQIQKLATGTGVNLTKDQVSSIGNKAGGDNQAIIDLLHALAPNQTTALKGNVSLFSTFNLTVPAGAGGLTAKQIAQQLYNQFQGTQ